MVTRFPLVLLLLLAAAGPLSAQRTTVFEEIRTDANKRAALDGVYRQERYAQTPAPKGYEAVYIAHYGRHGSRYSYSARMFTEPIAVLEKARKESNLTDFGGHMLDTLTARWKTMQYKIGDLTPLGWQQHQFIGKTMVATFPAVFGKGSVVDAASSPTVRSIISMASCCEAVAKAAPKCSVYAHQGMLDYQATRPNYRHNPFMYKGPDQPFPYPLSNDEYMEVRFPAYRQMLGRLFKEVDTALAGFSPAQLVYDIALLVQGRLSLPEEDRMDLTGLMTDEEQAGFWEVYNYMSYREYFKYRTACSAIVDDMMAKADVRLESGERGADLRFGHDHCLLALLMVLDVDGLGTVASTAEEIPLWFQNFRAPMAGNVQCVFFRPRGKRSGDVLVKVLLNGEEMPVGGLTPVSGPYYRWPELRAFWKARTDLFVTR